MAPAAMFIQGQFLFWNVLMDPPTITTSQSAYLPSSAEFHPSRLSSGASLGHLSQSRCFHMTPPCDQLCPVLGLLCGKHLSAGSPVSLDRDLLEGLEL